MAKDPAFLFYSGDFLTGVTGMSMEERGQYITLLCLQHAKGHLSLELINRSVPGLSSYVLEKFQQDDDGFYFNQRLEEEAIKRNKFCKSRSENRKGKENKDMFNICETSVLHMENENVNRDIVNLTNKGVVEKKSNLPAVVTKKRKGKYLSHDEFMQRMDEEGKKPVKIGRELVYLRLDQYQELVKDFGETMVREMILQLDLYKSQNDRYCGKELYVSDERVLRKSWVLKNAKDALLTKTNPGLSDIRKREKVAEEIRKSTEITYYEPKQQPE